MWAEQTSCVWNQILRLIFSRFTNGARCGLTGKFFSFVAVKALCGWIGVKSGDCSSIQKICSHWAVRTYSGSVVILMLRCTGRTNTAIGCLMGWLCAFDAKEALVEVVVKSRRHGVVEEVASSWTSSAGGSSTLMIRIRSDWAICTVSFFGVGVGADGTVDALRRVGQTRLSRVSASRAIFALRGSSESYFIGVGANRA